MKRLIPIILTIALLASALTGCGNSNSETAAGNTGSNSSAADISAQAAEADLSQAAEADLSQGAETVWLLPTAVLRFPAEKYPLPHPVTDWIQTEA